MSCFSVHVFIVFFPVKFVCSDGLTVARVMPLVSSHASQPWEGGRGTPLCGPPLRRSSEHGGSAVRAALAASESGSSVRCNASLVWHFGAQRHRSRRKRRGFMWGARSANGPLGQTLAPAECWKHLRQRFNMSPMHRLFQ